MKKEGVAMIDVGDRHFLFAMITALANRMQAAGDTVFEEITWKQWFVLLGASIFETTPSVSQIADRIGTSHQNAKQLLLRLQKANFVSLEKDPQDQRRTLVRFTERFLDFEKKHREGSAAFIEGIYEGIDAEKIRTAREVLEIMDNNLKTLSRHLK